MDTRRDQLSFVKYQQVTPTSTPLGTQANNFPELDDEGAASMQSAAAAAGESVCAIGFFYH